MTGLNRQTKRSVVDIVRARLQREEDEADEKSKDGEEAEVKE